MPKFIIGPKLSLKERLAATVAMPAVRLTEESKTSRRSTALEIRQHDPEWQRLNEWMEDATGRSKGKSTTARGARMTKRTAAKTLATPSPAATQKSDFSWTVIADLTEDQAADLRRDVPEFAVFPDRRIELIRPMRSAVATGAKAAGKLTTKDLWHLKRIDVVNRNGRRTVKQTGAGVKVAILDTGVEPVDEIQQQLQASYAIDRNAGQVVPLASHADTDGHGTHVAGLVAGKKVGVAPGAELVSLTMIPNGWGNLSDFILAIEWVASRNDIQIMNMSAGIPGFVPEIQSVVADLVALGVLPVIAIGNEGRNRTRSPGNYGEILSVGACKRDDFVAAFSSSGTLDVDHHVYPAPASSLQASTSIPA